jgi:hypothetical protein
MTKKPSAERRLRFAISVNAKATAIIVGMIIMLGLAAASTKGYSVDQLFGAPRVNAP